jgi:hypothetical protein
MNWLEIHNNCPCRKDNRCTNSLPCSEEDCFLCRKRNVNGIQWLPVEAISILPASVGKGVAALPD